VKEVHHRYGSVIGRSMHNCALARLGVDARTLPYLMLALRRVLKPRASDGNVLIHDTCHLPSSFSLV
jgi:hypothetical protein